MLGFYENFPANIHLVANFTSAMSNRQLQQRLIQVLYEANRKKFSFGEVAHPAVSDCTIIFEFGIAEATGFNYIDEEEKKKMLNATREKPFRSMDFFCAVRYYKSNQTKKTPLKFDYYMARIIFSEENSLELQIFHERGPRYISPEDLVAFVVNRVNEASSRKTLKRINI